MPRPIARATATLRLRTSSSSRATAPPPTRNSQLTSNGYSAEHENLAYRGRVASGIIHLMHGRGTSASMAECLRSSDGSGWVSLGWGYLATFIGGGLLATPSWEQLS